MGHDTTPFLLDHMRRSTEDRSLEVNVAVYRGNVALGAEVARALAGARARADAYLSRPRGTQHGAWTRSGTTREGAVG